MELSGSFPLSSLLHTSLLTIECTIDRTRRCQPYGSFVSIDSSTFTLRIVANLEFLSLSRFGGMFGSGIKAGLEAIKLFDSYDIVEGEVMGPAQVKLAA